ncbi:hypothetical protein, partial [Sansalvadorimonas verongulae]|uniref:hypothetical protein n=1 Tax=Sansalvadorimonas verongulae TaxID=2172824 RepID=UPI0018AD2DCB
ADIIAGKKLKSVDRNKLAREKVSGDGEGIAGALNRAIKSEKLTDRNDMLNALVEDLGSVLDDFFYDSNGDLNPGRHGHLNQELEKAIEGSDLSGALGHIQQQPLGELIVSAHAKQGGTRQEMSDLIAEWVSNQMSGEE